VRGKLFFKKTEKGIALRKSRGRLIGFRLGPPFEARRFWPLFFGLEEAIFLRGRTGFSARREFLLEKIAKHRLTAKKLFA